jgi:hypothetical protein
LKVSFRPTSLAPGVSIDLPTRDDALDNAKEAVRGAMDAAAKRRVDVDAERARRSETAGAPTETLDDQETWGESAERDARTQVDRADSATQPQPAGDTRYEDIRAAGETRIEHQICTFWEDRSFRDGAATVHCCVLKHIWVLPVAHIRINPRRRLYIRESGTSEERINGEAFDRLTPQQQGRWLLAEPFSVQEHERAHARDYRDRLAAFLAAEIGGARLRYREYVVSASDWAAADARVKAHLGSLIALFYAQYVLADQQQYPHGFSESAAVDAQREALDRGKDRQEDRFADEDEESARDIQRAMDEEARAARCPHQPAATPHCLRAV